jgi:hypothetical protein
MRLTRIVVVIGVLAALIGVPIGVAPPVTAAEIATTTCTEVPKTESASPVAFDSYEPQSPQRIVDTRDGLGGVTAPLDAACTLIVDVSSSIPVTARGLALSVTVVASEPGFFTAFPCAQGRPSTSSVNARPGLASANLVVVAPDSTGRVCIYSSAGGNVIVDVSGWWAPGTASVNTRFTAIEPVRALDTRELPGATKRPAGEIREIDIAGVAVPDDAVAVAVNMAAVNPTTAGFLVVYPCGGVPPLASNVNFAAGERRAVAAIVEIGESGRICVTGNAETHSIIDVTGFYAPSSTFGPVVALAPVADTRVVDTRRVGSPFPRFSAGSVQRFDLSASLEQPDDTVAAVLNVVATQANPAGFLTVWPCTQPRPTTSSLNYDLGQTANLVVTALSADAEVCVYASTAVHVVVDLVGTFAGPPDSLVNQISLVDEGGAFVPIDQAFEVPGTDYSLHCDPGVTTLDLRLGLAPGVSATVNDVAVDDLDSVVTIPEDGLLSIELVRGAERAAYYLRCVPADFPRFNFTRNGNAPGWYLVELGWNSPQLGRFLALLDERGVPVWYKRTERKLIDAKLLSDGTFVASPISGLGLGVSSTIGHRVFDLDGKLLDVRLTSDPVALPADHHDYVEIPGAGPESGRALISYPLVKNVDLSGMVTADPFTGTPADPRCKLATAPTTRSIVDGVIDEIAPSGANWRWAMSDYFSIEEVTYPQCFGNYTAEPGGSEVDVFHINSLQRVAEPGCEPLCDYVMSARHLDAVVRVDRATGDVEWILGSRTSDPTSPDYVPNKSGAPRLEVIGDPLGGPLRMHDARLSGNLLTMHDNRVGINQPSRIVTYRIDTAAGTATLVRQFDQPRGLTGGQLGSAQVLADGGVVVAWGATQPMYAEYDADDNELMRLELVVNDSAYRILKYAPATFDAAELRDAAGGSVQAPP